MLSDTQIIIEVAKLDGWKEAFPRDPALGKDRGGILLPYKYEQVGTHKRAMEYPDYLTSRDAIIPVIEKQEEEIIVFFFKELQRDFLSQDRFKNEKFSKFKHLAWWSLILFATPRQLCIELLKAVGKWEE